MNYIVEINMFYDWLETNRVAKSVIALWHVLMHINNKTNWSQSFEVAISTLEFKTGFRRSELCRARNILEQKGRIKWKARGGNLCAVYSIIPFCVHNTDTSADTSADTKLTTNKLNYTKLKSNIPPIPPKGDDCDPSFEIFWNLYDKKTGSKEKLQKKWEKLPEKERLAIFDYLPKYKEAQPDKKYRKNPETFLNNKSWNDELIFENKRNGTHTKSDSKAERDAAFASHIARKLGIRDTDEVRG
jgi:hypothetical protein